MRTLGRILLALLAVLRGKHRRREREERRRTDSEAALRRAEAINTEIAAATARGQRGRIPKLAQELEEAHEQVRRRPAEPPVTMSREIVATPRMELAVLLALLVGAAAAIAFVVLYVVHPDTQLLGLCAGVVCVAFALAAVIAGKRLVPQERAVTEYHWFGDDEAAEDVEAIVAESGDGISRRRLLLGAAGAAGTAAAAAAAVPLASLGPDLGDRLAATAWRAGRAVVKEDGSPVRADEVQEGAFLLGLPEGSDPRHQLADAINLLRIPLDQLDLPADRKARCPGGVVAYSRICTHAGCAVSMYRVPLFAPHEPSPALICPCHYSTFDPRRGCAVDFGPAPRPLPQLPLRINERGELEAAGGFYEPPGPGYSLVRLQKGRDE